MLTLACDDPWALGQRQRRGTLLAALPYFSGIIQIGLKGSSIVSCCDLRGRLRLIS